MKRQKPLAKKAIARMPKKKTSTKSKAPKALTKKLEAELLKVHETYWNCYLKGDVKTMATLLADGYTQVGSAEAEVFFNKSEAVKFLRDTIKQVAGKVDMRKRVTKLEAHGDLILIHELCDLYGKPDKQWVSYSKFRASTWLKEINKSWKIIHQHSSFPDARTEGGENLAIEKIEEENQQLREAVKRRTIELEQNYRELEIEAALERVRARSMGMQKSEELKEVIQVVFDQLVQLKINLDHSGFVVDYKPKGDWHFWIADKQEIPSKISHPYFDSVWANQFNEAKKKRRDFFATNLNFKEKNKFYRDLFKYVPGLSEKSKEFYFKSPGLAISTVLLESVGLYIENFSGIPYTDEENNALMRFGKVFQQTYTRFLDLQKAEAQIKEAQIEAGLERVRSKTMAMHNSQHVGATVATLFDELMKLGVEKTVRCGIIIVEDTKQMEVWTAADKNGKVDLIIGHLDMNVHALLLGAFDAWKDKQAVFKYELVGDDLKDYFRAINNSPDYPLRVELDSLPLKMTNTEFYFGEGAIFTFTLQAIPNEAVQIFKRFASVFGQTYRRFLDLCKAEAQAREAQIEAALERVRSRSMAMHKSDELTEVSTLLFKELLGFCNEVKASGIALLDRAIPETWMCSLDLKMLPPIHIPIDLDEPIRNLYKHWESGQELFCQTIRGEDLKQHNSAMLTVPEIKALFDNRPEIAVEQTECQTTYAASFRQGYLLVVTENPVESSPLFPRFAKVFGQTYTRFLDLQKAEAQAREAHIEAALERVRSRSMAMHTSDELLDVIKVVSGQFQHLGFKFNNVSFAINNESNDFSFWSFVKGTPEPIYIQVPYINNPMYEKVKKIQRVGIKFYSDILTQEDNKQWVQHLFNHNPTLFSEEVKEYLINRGYARSIAITPHIWLILGNYESTPYTDAENEIIKRFGAVFEQSYTRFLDLQKAEAQAREAQIEAALERVRSRTMAMQHSDELADAAFTLFQQLENLNVVHERINIGIVNEEKKTIDFWITGQGGNRITTRFSGRVSEPTTLAKAYAAWKQGEKSLVIDQQGDDLQQWLKYMDEEIKIPFDKKYLHNRRVQTAGFFSKGMLIVTSPEPLPTEAIYLLEKFAGVFDLTYTRFSDLKHAEAQALKAEEDLIAIRAARKKAEDALTELQITQRQLIHAEKMASLGELTAGIAHEIQNPLNFVNNFSEVNNELLEELKHELAAGSKQLAEEILNDIQSNSEKINHHGKRAGDIVKGMLQHSRSSSGVKEPTNINALADEYLRLAYHGLRAKDKSFAATMKTDFAETICNINIIPQDIGRVILNLITNAFYVVNEKSKQNIAGYEPTVSISTHYSLSSGDGGGEVIIKVKDNGNGIPDSIKEKIFQPFFTTKPTGQGTGLGLSLSYDIVKAHGGELKVETEHIEGFPAGASAQAGSEFIIQLPIV